MVTMADQILPCTLELTRLHGCAGSQVTVVCASVRQYTLALGCSPAARSCTGDPPCVRSSVSSLSVSRQEPSVLRSSLSNLSASLPVYHMRS